MTEKEIKDWVSLANSTDVNKAIAGELLMQYAGDLEMLERCFRAWMEQMLVDVINTVRDTINGGNNVAAWWEVNHFPVMVGHNIWPDKDRNMKTTCIRIVFPIGSYIECYEIVTFNLDTVVTVEDTAIYTDLGIWYIDDLDMDEELGHFPNLLNHIS